MSVNTSDGYFSNSNNLGPVANFTFSPSSPKIGDTVTFNATNSFDPDNAGGLSIGQYRWDFGDGASATSSSPLTAHIYARQPPCYCPPVPFTGNFSVRLTVVDTDNGFEGMITHSVQVTQQFPVCQPGHSVLHVPEDCPTILSAIDSITIGGTILVAPGSYRETILVAPETYEEGLIITKPLSLLGSGSNQTIVNGFVSVEGASTVTVSGFTILQEPSWRIRCALCLSSSPNGVISNNRINGAIGLYGAGGIQITGSTNVSLIDNTIQNETFGISLQYSPGAILRRNTMLNNLLNFDVSGSYSQDIDKSNTINGQPIFYGIATDASNIPPDPGFIGIINSHDLMIGPVSISNVNEGILIVNSTRITINGLTVQNVITGASIVNSSAIALANSRIGAGPFYCTSAALDNTVQSSFTNDTFSCSNGISLYNSSSNQFVHNRITAGGLGLVDRPLFLDMSRNVYHICRLPQMGMDSDLPPLSSRTFSF
ncbi:MAG TPA: NosD domain-containing protein [Candidatus Dormibacteraeota bacterium]|jgi:parallel beta-helix repeat protein|nr:NosD domain-containing protein [Candidatus Dormibacteraeota bacterium]